MNPTPTPEPTQPPEDPWASCTFEGSELATLRHGAKLTFTEKVAWLEQMHRLSLQFQESRRKRGIGTVFQDGRVEY